MTIRPLAEQDLDSVVALMLLNWDGIMSRHHSAGVVAKFRAEVTAAWLRRQTAWKQIFVVEDAGAVVATGALADFGRPGAPRLCVSQFFVRPAVHGRGIGRRLLRHLTHLARRSGATRLHVPSSRNAIPFYGASGFAVDAEQPDARDEITWMTLDLRAGPAPGRGDGRPRPPPADTGRKNLPSAGINAVWRRNKGNETKAKPDAR